MLMDMITKTGSMREAGLGDAIRASATQLDRCLPHFLVWAPIRPRAAFTTLHYKQLRVCVFPTDFMSRIFNSQFQISILHGTW